MMIKIFWFGILLPLIGNSYVFAMSEVTPVAADQLPQNSNLWRHAMTPTLFRVGLSASDGVGGPVRYNTHFPEKKGNPHPASYYHSMASIGIELEYPVSKGGVLLGMISRRDLAHKNISSRSAVVDDTRWTVDSFDVSDYGFLFGWVFGQRYHEAPWFGDLSLVYDRAAAHVDLVGEQLVPQKKYVAQVNLELISIRARTHLCLATSSSFQLSAGPDIHVPLWSKGNEQVDPEVSGWVSRNLELKSAAGIGLGVMSSLRF